MYYYFNNNKVIAFEEEVNCEVNQGYVPLTSEEVEYHLQNPNLSEAALKASLHSTGVVEQHLQGYKDNLVATISELSNSAISSKVTTLQLLDALASIVSSSEDTVYNNEESLLALSTFHNIGKQCRDKYYMAVAGINNATTCEEADTAFNEAASFYNSIIDSTNE